MRFIKTIYLLKVLGVPQDTPICLCKLTVRRQTGKSQMPSKEIHFRRQKSPKSEPASLKIKNLSLHLCFWRIEGTNTDDIMRIVWPGAPSAPNLLFTSLPWFSPSIPSFLLHNSCCGRELVSSRDELTAAHPPQPPPAWLGLLKSSRYFIILAVSPQ